MQNFENLEDMLINLDHNFNMITLSEVWNSEEKKATSRPGELRGYYEYLP